EGPAAYVFPADDPRLGTQAELLRTLQLQGCEISRAIAPFTVTVRKKKQTNAPAATGTNANPQQVTQALPANQRREAGEQNPQTTQTTETSTTRTFPAGSYIVRMDQPYSRIADALLDYQYWSPNDPQRQPYDDTGWTFGELYG